MRIVDQSGCVDIPYEQTVLVIDEGSIVARIPDGGQILMAQYSGIEKSRLAMKRLHSVYDLVEDKNPVTSISIGKPSEYFYFPAEEKL